jgi:hypothetical protein
LGRPAYLAAKAKGDKSMPVTRETPESVYGAGPQAPCDMARAGLLEAQIPAVQWYTPCHHAHWRGRRHQVVFTSPPQSSGRRAMSNDLMQGIEWAAYVALDTFSATRTRDSLRGASPTGTESP